MITLQKAVHLLVRDSKHPAKKIAAEAGMSYGYLTKAADEMQPDFQLQARMVAPLTKAAETDVLIDQIAQDCGGIFVRLTPTSSNDAHTAKTLKEVADYFTRLAEAAPGGFTVAEVATIEVEGHDVIAAVLAQISKLRAEAK